MYKILIIEDEVRLAKTIEDLLKEHEPGINVSICRSVKTAARKIKSLKPDNILLDLNLLDSFGANTLEKIINTAGYKPIVLTGMDDDITVSNLKKYDLEYFIKPDSMGAIALLLGAYRNQKASEENV